MTVEETNASEKQSGPEKIWYGPASVDVQELVSKWKSLGHYFFSKFDGEFANTILLADFESGRTWTGAQLKSKILNVACALVDKFQFKPNTTVCISYDNSDHLFILACGVLCAGGTVACAYSKDPYAELLYLARKVEPEFLFCHAKNIGWARKLEQDLGLPVNGVVMDKQLDDEQHSSDVHYFEHLFWYDHTTSPTRELIPIACRDARKQVALITMSSGTSGKPKAVAQSHWNALAELLANPRKVGPGFNFACCASLDYVSGRLIMFGAIHAGYQAIILNGFEPRTFLQACQRYKVHIIYIGAASFYNLITYKHLEQYDISSVRMVFPMGAKIIYLDELRHFFKRHAHIKHVRQGYGASELSGVAMNMMPPEEYLEDCENCGQLLQGMRAKIVDPHTGRSLGANQQGILHVRGETVFPGYYDRGEMRLRREKRLQLLDNNSNVNDKPHALESQDHEDSPFISHEEIFDSEGFYISGDYAYFNDKDELYIKGRQKELMNCRGQKKVLPQELEAIVDQHPAVHKVCVLGLANKRELTLHCPRAFVVVKSNYYTDERPALSSRLSTLNQELNESFEREQLTHSGNRAHPLNRMEPERRRLIAEDLMQFVNERVGWEKQLTAGIVLLDDIPTSRATGKFDKNYLRALTPDQVEIYGDRSG